MTQKNVPCLTHWASTFLHLLEGSTTDGLGGAAASNFCLGDGSARATLPALPFCAVEGLRNSTAWQWQWQSEGPWASTP